MSQFIFFDSLRKRHFEWYDFFQGTPVVFEGTLCYSIIEVFLITYLRLFV